METKACTACAKARRKCSKQKPHCLRCRTRGLDCRYPPSGLSSYIVLEDHFTESARKSVPTSPLLPLALDQSLLASLSAPCEHLQASWFASADTWRIDRAPAVGPTAIRKFSSDDLDHVLRAVFRWLSDWTQRESNPFIHRELYRHRIPSCIQDVYMALSGYLQKTPFNQHMIYRILEEQVMRLVADEVASPANMPQGQSLLHPFDPLEQLGRIHALLVYQCIGLYDGHIRLRHLAEQHIPILERWLVSLTVYISQAGNCGGSLTTAPAQRATTQQASPASTSPQSATWHSWIFIESTRRTWLITAGIQGIYKCLRDRQGDCMGGTVFTSRQGFWEASSACEWEKRCIEIYSGLVRISEMDKMFAMVPKDELNEFTILMIQCTFGLDQASRWGVRLR
ncbi:hypothetical protein T440DRAFT_472819 [Plenodomus tracheiphilus IPT5]|uniref:Zn(2)-C6 fungal-type domain-containing protein n=1 Tax=Plenodomus tracheiphilus IPT5 TaxID=1408161 RepID=A0A6A7AR96_9PLEO|nr:hypothetical protein T440DRAFT_472819 [Plenodomus tracheiphilus IPT5]